MDTILYHLYSGQMFFTATLVAFAVALLSLSGLLERNAFARSTCSVLALAALFAAGLSGTPVLLPQAIAAATSIAAFVLFGIVAPPARRRALALLALLAALGSAASEVRWHLGATKLPVPRRLIVIGDSLSSGGFGESSSWPALTGRGHRAVVLNLALPGETASAAVQNQLPELPGAMPGDCVIVAIGGNDMLEGLPSRDFESSLDRILASSREAGRRPVAMLELPIVPGEWRFGAIQRRLARRHGVALIPKRVLAGVLLAPGSTFDGLHPTQQGHERLAREIGRSLGW